jgi:hypothetical protein
MTLAAQKKVLIHKRREFICKYKMIISDIAGDTIGIFQGFGSALI